MDIIQPDNYESQREEELYEMIVGLSQRSNLIAVPEVAIYDSPDINAFATGRNQKNALVAFSRFEYH